MTWTTEKPTQPGWYWYKHPTLDAFILQVEQGPSGTLRVYNPVDSEEVGQFEGQWYGPLEPPPAGPVIATTDKAAREFLEWFFGYALDDIPNDRYHSTGGVELAMTLQECLERADPPHP